jgi:hypothetical protein
MAKFIGEIKPLNTTIIAEQASSTAPSRLDV